MLYAVEAQLPLARSKNAMFNLLKRRQRLAHRFLELPHEQQQEIVEPLDLVRDGDRTLPVDEQSFLFFQRAVETGKLAIMWRLVEERFPDGEPDENPFLTE